MKIFLAVAVLVMAASCQNNNEKNDKSGQVAISQEQKIKKGEYLVGIIGCGDCHTPKKMTEHGPVPDMDKFLSGHDASRPLADYDKSIAMGGQWVLFNGDVTAAAGPWGVSFAANLTPDPTGLGNWDYEHFRKAMKEGKFKGIDAARSLLPPMPWQNFATMSDEDLQSIYEYLKTIRPVSNRVPDAILAGL